MRYSSLAMAVVSALVLLSFGCGGDGDGNGDSVTATRPPTAASATPAGTTAQGALEFTGTAGNITTDEFKLNSGKVVFHLTHEGTGEFFVVLNDSGGNQVANLIGGSGMHVSGLIDETKTVNVILPGLYLLKIRAGGDWTIDVEE